MPALPSPDFAVSELSALTGWAGRYCLELEVVEHGADFADEVAYIGMGDKVALWTLHRGRDGVLWLERIAGVPWGRPVQTVEEAMARIAAELTTASDGRSE